MRMVRQAAVGAAAGGAGRSSSSRGIAAAHAELISVSPATAKCVDVAPPEVVLTFSEPVSLTGWFGARPRRRRRRRVDGDDAGGRDDHRRPRQTVLPTARTPSSSRSSPSTRTASVARRSSTSARRRRRDSPAMPSTSAVTTAGWGVRAGAATLSAVGYAGALIAAGTLFFSMYTDRRAELRAVTSRAAVLGAVALVAAVPFRIARLGGGLDALRDNDVLMSALRGPVGVSTAVTANRPARRRRARRPTCAAMDRPARVALVALAGFSIEGHTRATATALGDDRVRRRPPRRRGRVAGRDRRPRRRLPHVRPTPAGSPRSSAASATPPSSPSASSP